MEAEPLQRVRPGGKVDMIVFQLVSSDARLGGSGRCWLAVADRVPTKDCPRRPPAPSTQVVARSCSHVGTELISCDSSVPMSTPLALLACDTAADWPPCPRCWWSVAAR